MTQKVTIKRAVSAAGPQERRYCLLQANERVEYRCAEAADNLGATAEETRSRAYWQHYKTHVKAYTRWAKKKGLFDPTLRYADPLDAAAELVEDVLISFYQMVQEGRYDAERGPPCKYIKRSIKNRFQDLLRRGRHPTTEECMQCWEERGFCPAFRTDSPWEQGYHQQCYRLPVVGEFDAVSAEFAAAGLHDQWPPLIRDTQIESGMCRPVEDQALKDVMVACIWSLVPKVLTSDQQTVLVETFLHQKASREIAQLIQTTPGNVDQIRRRGLRRLYRALSLVGLSTR